MGNSHDLHLGRPEPIDQPEGKPSQSKPTVIRVESRSERLVLTPTEAGFFDLGGPDTRLL